MRCCGCRVQARIGSSCAAVCVQTSRQGTHDASAKLCRVQCRVHLGQAHLPEHRPRQRTFHAKSATGAPRRRVAHWLSLSGAWYSACRPPLPLPRLARPNDDCKTQLMRSNHISPCTQPFEAELHGHWVRDAIAGHRWARRTPRLEMGRSGLAP